MGTDISPSAIELPNRGDLDDRIVILMIPGNPGNELFYADFVRKVIRQLLSREERLGTKKQQWWIFKIILEYFEILSSKFKSVRRENKS